MKIIVSEDSGKSHSIELDDRQKKALVGVKIGSDFDASAVGLTGYKIKITGGSDKDGFPMHPNVHGRVRGKVLLSGRPGLKPKEKGEKRRKRVRGNVITPEIVQVNAKVVKKGKKPIETLIGKVETKEEEG